MRQWCFRKILPWGFRVSLLGQASSAVSSALSGSLQDHVSWLTEHGREGKKICDMLLRKAKWSNLFQVRFFCLLGENDSWVSQRKVYMDLSQSPRCLLLGRKAMTGLDSILKSRDITLPTKACLVKAKVVPVIVHGCERLSCPTACGIFPDKGLIPSPALAGGFFTTEPPHQGSPW